MTRKNTLQKDSGDSVQVFPLQEGCVKAQTAAGAIDTSDASLILILTDCNVYVGSDTTTFAASAGMSFGVEAVDSITTDAAISYLLV